MGGGESRIQCALESAPSPAQWAAFLPRVAGAGPFHLPEWRRALLEAHPGLRDTSLWLEQDGELRAFLPLLLRRRLVLQRVSSQPYGSPGGPWLRDPADTDAAGQLLCAFRRRHVRPWNDCVMVDHGGLSARSAIESAWPGARWHEAHTHRFKLPSDINALEEIFERRVRKGERRAGAMGLRLERCESEAGLAEFMAFQHREAAQRRVRFTYPVALLRAGIRDGWLRLHRVRREQATLAVTAIAEGLGTWFAWLVAHSPASREAPTGDFLYSGLLRDAVHRGLRTADFGHSGGREGAEFFKEGFGARPAVYHVWRSGPLAGMSH